MPRSRFTTEEVWLHQDGKHAYLGSGGGGDVLYALDISNPANPVVTDSIISNTRRVNDVMLSTVSIHVKFANDAVGYLLSQRGDATYGLGGWWSLEVAGTHGTFCIENCIEKVTFWPTCDSKIMGLGTSAM